MNDAARHLTEDQRQELADGTSSLADISGAEAHLRQCASCRDDVDRLRALMRRVETIPAPAPISDDLWPAIRSRIDAAKIEPLADSARRLRPRRPWKVPALAIAAAVIVILVLLIDRRRGAPARPVAIETDTGSMFTTVSDSARVYEDEARTLLNQLEMQRSMLRPEATNAIDHDLRIVDSAIAEVRDALKHDPNNPGLKRLLASSYRQKVFVLRRVGNAG